MLKIFYVNCTSLKLIFMVISIILNFKIQVPGEIRIDKTFQHIGKHDLPVMGFSP